MNVCSDGEGGGALALHTQKQCAHAPLHTHPVSTAHGVRSAHHATRTGCQHRTWPAALGMGERQQMHTQEQRAVHTVCAVPRGGVTCVETVFTSTAAPHTHTHSAIQAWSQPTASYPSPHAQSNATLTQKRPPPKNKLEKIGKKIERNSCNQPAVATHPWTRASCRCSCSPHTHTHTLGSASAPHRVLLSRGRGDSTVGSDESSPTAPCRPSVQKKKREKTRINNFVHKKIKKNHVSALHSAFKPRRPKP